VREREDIVDEFKDMLASDGPSLLLIKVNEQIEDADRVPIEPPEMTRRFKAAVEKGVS
jgi:phosphonopyruvate decarboxylase/sulfopyruvate decarboxylase subunit beta